MTTNNGTKAFDRIFAIGDIALMKTNKYPKGYPGLPPVAIQQGKHLAKNLNRFVKGKAVKEFRYIDKGALATVGRNKAVADLRGNIHFGGFAGWVIWMFVHLMYLVGFRNKAVVLANWSWNYFTYDRGIRIILRPSSKQNDRIIADMSEEMSEV